MQDAKTRLIRDCRAANDSKAYAHAIHAAIPEIHCRARHYSDHLRALGVPGHELCGQLLEFLEWKTRKTHSQFGAYDTAEKIATELGCSPSQVRRRVEKLKAFGLVETALGIPRGRTGPTVHYRLTAAFGRLVRGIVRTVKTVVAKASKLALPGLSTKNPRGSRPFKSQATRHPVPAAHKPFTPNPPKTPSNPVLAALSLAGIKKMLIGAAKR